MADIEFVKPHSLTIAKARALVQKTADALAAEYGLSSEWHGNTLHFHRSGVDGQMHVTDSEVRLHVTLGFLLKAFKGTLSIISSATSTNCWLKKTGVLRPGKGDLSVDHGVEAFRGVERVATR
jgi:putative polyhydroxyalkanoate system protein